MKSLRQLPLILTVCFSQPLFANPAHLIGEWRATFHRFNETITFRADGTLERTTSTIMTSVKSEGTWKLDGDRLQQTIDGETTITKIQMVSPTKFKEPINCEHIKALVYQKRESSDNMSQTQTENSALVSQ